MEPVKANQVGTLKISQEVVVAIARVAAMEVDGVESLVESQHNLKGFFNKKIRHKPIETILTDDFAEINIALNIKYGAKIAEVCKAVQTNVKDNVQTMTGIVVSKVNIVVTGIVFQQPEDTL